MGYNITDTNGKFTENTKLWIAIFQESQGLSVDGKAGRITIPKMIEKLGENYNYITDIGIENQVKNKLNILSTPSDKTQTNTNEQTNNKETIDSKKEAIIRELGLKKDSTYMNFYCRPETKTPGFYQFDQKWNLYYHWGHANDSKSYPQKYGGKDSDKEIWTADTTFLINQQINRCKLTKNKDNTYTKEGWSWSFTFDEKAILHYSWGEINDKKYKPQLYNYVKNKREIT